ncbi:MarR family winged helix-turn-helix transcriptional regulator [Paenibacillus puerhi]|uniref:MarR family winged helix-turn-helix transcriptional regulator n=1 Tax=Paenibacillus puerhi TaxID=2692622 RepID=UPI0013584B05|nr:MarR family transcriptional regulator [Paenibacillus puerhi]
MTGRIDEDHAASLKAFVVLSKAYKTVMDRAVKDMKQYGLSPSEFMILEVLYTKGRIPLQQIGEKVLVTSGSITYNVDKLEKKGFLKRIPCEEDRRVIYADITAKGREQFDLIFPKHTSTIHSLARGLSLEEKREVIELLKKWGKGAEHDN